MSDTKYDPNVKYGWDKDTKFELSGNEFGLILNTLRSVLGTPESQKILVLNQANNVMEEALKRSVETGMVKPAKITDSPIADAGPNMAPKKVKMEKVTEDIN